MEHRPWHDHYDYTVEPSYRYPKLAVFDLLALAAGAQPDKTALHFLGTEISFYELRQYALKMANALAGLGIEKGDRIVLHLPNCPQYPIAYYAALMNGAIVTNANPMYTPHELKYIVEETTPKALVTFYADDAQFETIHKLMEDVEIPNVIVAGVLDFIGGEPPKGLPDGWQVFSEVMAKGKATMPQVEVLPADACQIQFTGGTTGVPKGAVLNHANMITAILQCTEWGSSLFGLTAVADRITMSVLPYFHAYGNIVVMNSSMLNCATQIVLPRFDLDEFMDVLASFDRITYFPGVPTMITAIINHPRAEELNLGRKLALMNSGAAPMAVELIQQVKDLGISYSEGWGMSETTSLGISNPILGRKKQGSIGIPFPDTDIKIVDIETGTKEMGVGEPGELIMKSPLVMQGYWNAPDKTAEQIRDGWLFTGDIATRDEDWYFYIVDRKKDMIIAGGYNVYPREIDEVLFEHPKVQMAVTVGIPDEYRGETVKAFIVLQEGETATEEEIISFCREKLAAYKAPKMVEFRDSLPQSAVGKVLRRMLRDEEEEQKG
jgi:long-chain acyl-CoA synthetase